MQSLVLPFLVLLLSVPAVRSANILYAEDSNATDYIRTSCAATLYKDVCYSTLCRYARAIRNDPDRLARVAISVSLSRARRMAEYVSNLSRQADYGAGPRAAAALHDCFTNFGDAVDEIKGSLNQMRGLDTSSQESFRFQMSNVQTWMSAALTDEETCTDGFEDVPEGPVKSDVNNRATGVKQVTSNALALVNSFVNQASP
ncbi:21 kDa protein-like [Punica granatum]|uniref:Pectinesterase inhibitor domain-containing protein n=2 Tax=Punica granatum TaxID=22663 RepID=A0A218W4X6_PUNGR|nr:21 kDa protein-like [Punica granatum]OWM67825.1 hypothetical protein CDL15_Pgr010763 [Punica granatum]PKI78175.1 hypothetical protein CRG98_001503 [Punica granatum]